MSANLNYRDGQAAYFGTQAAWHKQGIVVSEAKTSEEAIKLALLDFNVEKLPLQTCLNDDCVDVPNYFATLRTDTKEVLGVVGNRYNVLQNKDAFTFIDELVGSKEAIFENAGALGKGERIWVSCKLPDKLVIGNDDAAENYFFITNSHDGSKAVEIAFTNVFIVCANTLREAIRTAKRKRSVRHTTNMNLGLHKAAELMGITRMQIEAQKEMFEAMRKVEITDVQLKKFIELALKPEREQIDEKEFSTKFKNQVDKVLEYGLSDPAQLIVERKGNLWGAYNAITGYYNNVDETENRLVSLMYGDGFRKSQQALDLAVTVIGNSMILS